MTPPCEYLPATGTPLQDLVLLHGWGSSREVWRPLLAPLRPWANITLLDIPGAAPGLAAAESDLPTLLQGILDCCPDTAVYLGWSLGGLLAMELAVRHPERVSALVTLCSNPSFVATTDWPGMAAEAFQAFAADVKQHPVAALKRFDTLQVSGSEDPRRLLRQLQSLRRRPASEALMAGLGWLENLDPSEALSTLAQPQLHLLAAQDGLVPPDVARAIESQTAGNPAAQVRLLPQGCHLLPLQYPGALAAELRGFLDNTGLLIKRAGTAAPELEKNAVAASFSRAATGYDSVARLQRRVGEQLLTQLDVWPGAPANVLDLGCGTGYFAPLLQARYPQARYLGLDIAPGMVQYARSRCAADSDWLVADAESLPLACESVDLIFSSLAVQWCYRPEHLLSELARVLRPGGLCVFSSLGPQTLHELRSAWAAVDSHQHVNTFLPASRLLDAAACVPGAQLTLQSQAFAMEYQRVRDLLDELKTLGAHNMNRSRPAGLTSRRALQGMLEAYELRRANGLLPATYDVIFGALNKR